MLTGIWLPQGAEFGGQSIPFPVSRFVIADERYRVESAEGVDEGRWRLDTSEVPHRLDLTAINGPHDGRTIRAIVRVRGELLQLCYEIGEDAARPREFGTAAGSTRVMVRYRREVVPGAAASAGAS